jgi:hypothetical protein
LRLPAARRARELLLSCGFNHRTGSGE